MNPCIIYRDNEIYLIISLYFPELVHQLPKKVSKVTATLLLTTKESPTTS